MESEISRNTCLGQMLQHLHYHWLNGWHFNERKALLQQLFKFAISVNQKKKHSKTKQQHQDSFLSRKHHCTQHQSLIMNHLSASLPSAMKATRSIRFSRSSSKTDWWNSSRGVPWRSRKGRADWRVGSRMPFSICSHVISSRINPYLGSGWY